MNNFFIIIQKVFKVKMEIKKLTLFSTQGKTNSIS